MCIVLVTTAHPAYAVIIIDNRDEFITRPTSYPHWWSSQHQDILSSRDLQRTEQGTWLGITKSGNFAVLTNFRETDANDKELSVQGQRSRGAMVTAWLTANKDMTTVEFVQRLLSGDGVKGVGGFSLVCGKLRRSPSGHDNEKGLEPLAIVSNRCGTADEVPWIAGQRDEVYGLSNTSYDDPLLWPKIKNGKKLLLKAVQENLTLGLDEEDLVVKLYAVLDTNTLPAQEGMNFDQYLTQLKNSIFIPPIGGGEETRDERPKDDVATGGQGGQLPVNPNSDANDTEVLIATETPDPEIDEGVHGIYGTQRQTIVLVDWEGNVKFRERSLWDDNGRSTPRGKADAKFEFKIEGWKNDEKTKESLVEPHA